MSALQRDASSSSRTQTVPASAERQLPFARLRVTIVAHHEKGMDIAALEPGVPLTVGRKPEGGMRVDNRTLSREHARFTLLRDRVLVEDAGSKNGVYAGGRRVTRTEIDIGEEVILGAVRVRAQALGSSGESLALAGEDDFWRAVEDERARAAHFQRPFALLLVRAVAQPEADAAPRARDAHATRVAERAWLELVRTRLRPVDRMALHGPDAVQVLLPETGHDESVRIARAIAGPVPGGVLGLLAGVAVYPGSAYTVEALVERSRSAAHRASIEAPVEIAPSSSWPIASGGEDAVVAGAAMREVLQMAERVASSRIPVILHGETGTGKEVLARFLHERGPRRGKRMVRVNCGALPKDLVESTLFGHERGAFTGASQQQKGIFEEADGGTVFLDEIGELPLAAQAALLRVLESGRFCRVGSSREIAVDVRIVTATHRDLDAMSTSGAFRADLYYRLGGVIIEIPPLRARRDEIEPLAMRFLRVANQANGRAVEGFTEDALEALRTYDWPGNVRELRNAVERAVVVARGGRIEASDLPSRVRGQPSTRPPPPPPGEELSSDDVASSPVSSPVPSRPAPSSSEEGPVRGKVQQYEAAIVQEVLEACEWNRNEAAKRLGLPVRTLSYRMKVLGIRKPEGN